MPRTAQLPLAIHPNLHQAFAQLYPTGMKHQQAVGLMSSGCSTWPRASGVALRVWCQSGACSVPISTQTIKEVESFLGDQELRSVPEDTADLDFTRQAQAALLGHVQQQIAPRPVNGNDLYSDVHTKLRILAFGCDSVDQLLLGGIREGQVTELVGKEATGKTQLCLQIAAVTAQRREGVLFIDTCASFSAARVLAIVQAAAANAPVRFCEDAGVSSADAIGCIQVQQCHDIQTLIAILHRAGQQLKERQHSGGAALPDRLSLLVIDSVSSLIAPILGAKQANQGHVLMIQLATHLKQLAANLGLAVLVTNHTVSGEGDKPALGESWRNQPHVRVLLTRQDNAVQPHRASLLASSVAALGPSALFEIGPSGVIGAAS